MQCYIAPPLSLTDLSDSSSTFLLDHSNKHTHSLYLPLLFVVVRRIRVILYFSLLLLLLDSDSTFTSIWDIVLPRSTMVASSGIGSIVSISQYCLLIYHNILINNRLSSGQLFLPSHASCHSSSQEQSFPPAMKSPVSNHAQPNSGTRQSPNKAQQPSTPTLLPIRFTVTSKTMAQLVSVATFLHTISY